MELRDNDRWRRLREQALLSQEDLAERAGVSVRTVRNLETGHIKRARASTVTRLITALGVSESDVRAPDQLPPDVAGYVERASALSALDAARSRSLPPFAVICGTGGVGKTALAVHWAHRVRDSFPDGVLYADLGGYGPGEPVDPGVQLISWLHDLGVPDGPAPSTLDDKAARYRSTLAHRRILVVVDNVRSAGQARPLLPGAGPSFAVVTSRDSLGPLVALDGAARLTVEPMSDAEARGLLRALLGSRAAAEPDAQCELVSHCCGLPLAIRIAAELANAAPATPLTALTIELRDERRRIDLLDLGDERSALRSIFAWSGRTLSLPAARLFRLLGSQPCGGLDDAATAALAGVPVADARRLAQELIRAHLLSNDGVGRDRYRMHDLLRAYARDHARPADQRRIDALLDYYLATATSAVRTVTPTEVPSPPPATGRPAFASAAAARVWLTDNSSALLAGAAWAATHGRPGRVIAFSAVLRRYLFLGGHARAALALHGRAYRAARHLGDRAAEGASLAAIAQVRWRAGAPGEAVRRYRQAVAALESAGDARALTTAWGGLGLVYGQQRRLDLALECFDRARTNARAAGDERGEALALANLGNVHRWSRRPDEAVRCYEGTLAVFHRLGDRANEGVAHANLGETHRQHGRPVEAAAHFERALQIARDAGDAATESDITTHLGLIADEAGDVVAAAELHERALAVSRRAGHVSQEASAAYHLGSLHQRRAAHDRAAEWLRRAVTLADAADDARLRCGARNGLGESLSRLGRGDEAWRCHAEALPIAEQAGCADEAERAARGLA